MLQYDAQLEGLEELDVIHILIFILCVLVSKPQHEKALRYDKDMQRSPDSENDRFRVRLTIELVDFA